MPSTTRNEVLALLYACLAELNEHRPAASQLSPSESTRLIGGTSGLDSLAYINLVAAIEQKIEARFQLQIMLQGPESFDSDSDPWRSVGALADYLLVRISSA